MWIPSPCSVRMRHFRYSHGHQQTDSCSPLHYYSLALIRFEFRLPSLPTCRFWPLGLPASEFWPPSLTASGFWPPGLPVRWLWLSDLPHQPEDSRHPSRQSDGSGCLTCHSKDSSHLPHQPEDSSHPSCHPEDSSCPAHQLEESSGLTCQTEVSNYLVFQQVPNPLIHSPPDLLSFNHAVQLWPSYTSLSWFQPTKPFSIQDDPIWHGIFFLQGLQEFS